MCRVTNCANTRQSATFFLIVLPTGMFSSVSRKNISKLFTRVFASLYFSENKSQWKRLSEKCSDYATAQPKHILRFILQFLVLRVSINQYKYFSAECYSHHQKHPLKCIQSSNCGTTKSPALWMWNKRSAFQAFFFFVNRVPFFPLSHFQLFIPNFSASSSHSAFVSEPDASDEINLHHGLLLPYEGD